MGELDGRGWVSAFVHFKGRGIYGDDCDRVLLEVVRPFVASCRRYRWIDRYFFIRYGDTGPHVRLRLLGDPALIRSAALPVLERRLARVQVNAGGNRLGLRLMAGVYEPEYERYGGPAGVAVAEDLFEASSDIVLRTLPFVTGTLRSRRLGQGLLLMLLTAHYFHGTRPAAARFFTWFGRNYLRALLKEEARERRVRDMFSGSFGRQEPELVPYVEMAWERLAASRPPSRRTAAFWGHMARVHRALVKEARAGRLTVGRGEAPLAVDTAALTLLASYLHMTSNRLGITLVEESFLSYLAARALHAPTVEGSEAITVNPPALAALRAR